MKIKIELLGFAFDSKRYLKGNGNVGIGQELGSPEIKKAQGFKVSSRAGVRGDFKHCTKNIKKPLPRTCPTLELQSILSFYQTSSPTTISISISIPISLSLIQVPLY